MPPVPACIIALPLAGAAALLAGLAVVLTVAAAATIRRRDIT